MLADTYSHFELVLRFSLRSLFYENKEFMKFTEL